MRRRGAWCCALVFIPCYLPDANAQFAVPNGYQRVADAHAIPSDLFYAIALAESGTRVAAQNALRPWPWTLHVHGEGRHYPSRWAATLALKEAIAQGQTSVDVGLMQVNWRYHQSKLGYADVALDPYHNLHVGAAILSDCYRSLDDWWAAVGCYHAPKAPQRAARYRDRVRKIWQRFVVQA